MPFISKEEVKEIRNELKKELPNIKFSVRKLHDMEVNITLVKGDIDFGTNREQVNQYHLENHWDGERYEVLKKVNDIASKNKHEVVWDGDYGSVPNYYVHIQIGRFDKPYEVK